MQVNDSDDSRFYRRPPDAGPKDSQHKICGPLPTPSSQDVLLHVREAVSGFCPSSRTGIGVQGLHPRAAEAATSLGRRQLQSRGMVREGVDRMERSWQEPEAL